MNMRMRLILACGIALAIMVVVWVNVAQVSPPQEGNYEMPTFPSPDDSPTPVVDSYLPAIFKVVTATPTATVDPNVTPTVPATVTFPAP